MTIYRQLIGVADLQDMIAAGDCSKVDCRIIDCRFDLQEPAKGRAEYLAGHIPGAVFADLDRDLAGPVTRRQ